MWNRYRLSILPFARLNIRSIDPFSRVSVTTPAPFAPRLSIMLSLSAFLRASSADGNSVFSLRLPPHLFSISPSLSLSLAPTAAARCERPLSQTATLTRDNELTLAYGTYRSIRQCRTIVPGGDGSTAFLSSRWIYVNRAIARRKKRRLELLEKLTAHCIAI